MIYRIKVLMKEMEFSLRYCFDLKLNSFSCTALLFGCHLTKKWRNTNGYSTNEARTSKAEQPVIEKEKRACIHSLAWWRRSRFLIGCVGTRICPTFDPMSNTPKLGAPIIWGFSEWERANRLRSKRGRKSRNGV